MVNLGGGGGGKALTMTMTPWNLPHGQWSGVRSGFDRGSIGVRSGVRFPYPPTLEKCAKGSCLCNLLRSTQPNDRETVIEG